MSEPLSRVKPAGACEVPVVAGRRQPTIDMVVDVGDVLARHGYQLDARGLGELRQHLWRLLHGRGTECTGGGR